MAHLVPGPDVASGLVGAMKPSVWNSRDSAELTWRSAEACAGLTLICCLPLSSGAAFPNIAGASAPAVPHHALSSPQGEHSTMA